MSSPFADQTSPVNRGTTAPGTNDGSFAPRSHTVPGLAAQLGDNTASQRLQVAIALVETGVRRRAGDDFTEPVSFDVIEGELRSMCPGVEEVAFEQSWTKARELAEDISTMERLWDDAERSGDWDGFDEYAWDASVEKDDFLIEDEEDGSWFVEHHDYAGTILADYEARMHDHLRSLVNRPGAAQAPDRLESGGTEGSDPEVTGAA